MIIIIGVIATAIIVGMYEGTFFNDVEIHEEKPPSIYVLNKKDKRHMLEENLANFVSRLELDTIRAIQKDVQSWHSQRAHKIVYDIRREKILDARAKLHENLNSSDMYKL